MDLGEKKSKRNSLDVWRIFFTAVIMMFHLVDGTTFYSEYPMFKYHWYIAVEFFFILSGFLMMKHIEDNSEESVTEYLKNRIVRLYPVYILAFIVMAVIRSHISGLNIFKIVIPNWLEAFMLQSIGTNIFPYVNNPAWYVSSLLIGSYLIYYLLKKFREAYLYFIGPVTVIVVFSYMYRTYGRLENFYTTTGFFFNSGLMRAVMGLTIGIYVFLLSKGCGNGLKRIPFAIRIVLEIVFLAGPVVFALLVEDGSYDFLFVIVFAIGILLASLNEEVSGFTNSNPIKALSGLSYAMYLSHFAAIFFLNCIVNVNERWKWSFIPVYFALTLIISLIYQAIASIIVKKAQCAKCNSIGE